MLGGRTKKKIGDEIERKKKEVQRGKERKKMRKEENLFIYLL